MRSSLPPAVLLGGETGAVSVARSLSAVGVAVHALGMGSRHPVALSRHCVDFTDFEGGGHVQERWLEWLERGPVGAVVLPCSDDGVELLAREGGGLRALGYRLIQADGDVMLTMIDKRRTYALARRLRIPVPHTVQLESDADLERVAEEIGFPCALKPLHAHLFGRHFGGTKVFEVGDAAELAAALARARSVGVEMDATEVVPGADGALCSYYSYLDEQGRPLVRVTRRKIRQYPIHFGIACYHVTEWIPDLAELGERFLRHAEVRGPAHVEFKRDERDGSLKLIECNHRFTNVNESVRLAGVDLALLTYNRLVGLPDPPVDSFREGVRMWHPVEDVRAFLAYRRRGELSLLGWVRSLCHRLHFPVFRLSDPKPTLIHYQRARSALRKRRSS